MEEMFTSAKRPFYQSTQIIVLTEIPLENYYSFAHSFFAKEKSSHVTVPQCLETASQPGVDLPFFLEGPTE